MSRKIAIYDTTLRDGTQGEGVSFSLQDKLNICERLAETGVDFIEGGYPLSNEKDVAFFEGVQKLDLGNSKNHKSFKCKQNLCITMDVHARLMPI